MEPKRPIGFDQERLTEEQLAWLRETARRARGDILKMTTLANSGHPGGSMSSIEIYLTVWSCANVDPGDPYHPDRDRIVVSHGHTSPGVYSALGRLGFVNLDEAIAGFRLAGTLFEGHVERHVPGVEWSTGNLGQGLSAACGFALASRLWKRPFRVFALMSDGEQQKGQVSEARRFARKYGLTNLTAVIDYNQIQISGHTYEVMPQNIRANWESDGWRVLEVDGHDPQAIYQALREAVKDEDHLVVILAHTVIGKGVSFMEDKPDYHGKAVSRDQLSRALEELGLENDLERYEALRKELAGRPASRPQFPAPIFRLDVGTPRTYGPEQKTDNRSAWGNALKDIALLNCGHNERSPIAVFDCDLATSVKTDGFAATCPNAFFQGGIQEHNTAVIAGALSTQGVVTFWADFGVFGIDEAYNQHRLNDINHTHLKLVTTHDGLDVGEDGKTHQCIDYVGVLRNLYGFRVIVPADPNQTDRVVRYIATQTGNFALAMGRSPIPVILDLEGKPLFGGDYRFKYGKADLVRPGTRAAIVTMGSMVYRAVAAWEKLKAMGIDVAVWNFSCPIDLDGEALERAAETGLLVTYEDHNVRTGLGCSVANALAEKGLGARLVKLGIPHYGASGKPDDLFKLHGLSVDHLIEAVRSHLA